MYDPPQSRYQRLTPHAHRFALAQASRSADVHNSLSRSRPVTPFDKRGSPEASTAVSQGRP
jgi:hypothetical protein